MKPYLIILYIIACIVTGAIADGLNDTGVQTWGHLLEAVEVLMLISFVLFKPKFIPLLLAYIFLRIAFFDIAYNLTAGHDWLHVGTSNWWDMFLSKQLPFGVVFGRVVFLVTGIAISLREQ